MSHGTRFFRRPLRNFLVLAGILFLALAFSPSIQTTLAAGDGVTPAAATSWKTLLFNNARTGYNPFETAINPGSASNLTLKWTAQVPTVPNNIFTQPIVVGNRIYWGAFDGILRATTLQGQEVWKRYLGKTNDNNCFPSTAGVTSTPTFTNFSIGGASHVLFVGGGNSRFYAVNADNGAVLWTRALGNSSAYFIWGSPAVYGGSVYIGIASFCDNPLVRGRMYKLSAATGQIQAVFNAVPAGCDGATIWSTPAIDAAAGVMYITTGNPGTCSQAQPYATAMLKLRLTDLKLVDFWQVPANQLGFDSDFGATPTLFNAGTVKMVGAINKNGIFYAFNRASLRKGPVWQTLVSGINCPQCNGLDLAPAAFNGRTLFVGAADTVLNGTYCLGTLAALDPATGTAKWQICLPEGPVMGSVTAVPGLVAVTEGTQIRVIEDSTGNTLYNYTSGAGFWGPVSIVNGRMYTGDNNGTFYAFGF